MSIKSLELSENLITTAAANAPATSNPNRPKLTVAALMAGGGVGFNAAYANGSELGLVMPVLAVEYAPDIAEVYAANYGSDHLIVDKVQELTQHHYPLYRGELDLLQASPECTRASTANSSKKNRQEENGSSNGSGKGRGPGRGRATTGERESADDISQAEAVVNALHWTYPRYFLLENVRGYLEFKSFRLILAALDRTGYRYHYAVVNMADWGVPQTRERLILLASRRDQPLWEFPAKTHQDWGQSGLNQLYSQMKGQSAGSNSTQPAQPPSRKNRRRNSKDPLAGQLAMEGFGITTNRRQWVGWYEAIADLIPTLEEDNFADWQLKRLPKRLLDSFAVSWTSVAISHLEEPFSTVTASFYTNTKMPNGFITDGQNSGQAWGPHCRLSNQPMHTLSASAGSRPANLPRAFVVEGTCAGSGDSATTGNKYALPTREESEPAFTITASAGDRPSHLPRAFIVNGQNHNPEKDTTARAEDEPSFTITGSIGGHGQIRAFLVSGQTSDKANPDWPGLNNDAAGEGDGVESNHGLSVRGADDPSFTVLSNPAHRHRAWLVDATHRTDGDLTAVEGEQPAFTVAASAARRPQNTAKGWLSQGRVVRMSPRALARFQSLPDSFILPDKAALACRVIGNGIPSLFIRLCVEELYRLRFGKEMG